MPTALELAIKLLHEEAGLTIKTIAYEVGLHYQTVWKVVTGKRFRNSVAPRRSAEKSSKKRPLRKRHRTR